MAVTVAVKIQGVNSVNIMLDKIKESARDMTSPLKKGGLIMLRSVDLNFQRSGRPKTWRPLAKSTLRWKIMHGYSPFPLIRSGDLRRSFVYRVENRNRLLVGTAVKYAPFHQFGTRTMPARPFLVFQRQDIRQIKELILKHIAGAK